MSFSPLRTLAFLPLIWLIAAVPAWAEGAGQEDLDKATAAKIDADSANDLSNVIDLLQSAIDKGLDETNEQFAEQLLTSTLLERAQILSRLIFDQQPPDERWPQIRQLILADVERALALDEDQPQGHFLRGRLLALDGGNREESIKSFTKVIDAPEDAVEPQTRALALVYRARLGSEPEKQLADFNRAVELMPKDVEILRTRAVYHLEQNRIDDAVADFRKATELAPEHAGTYEALGMALLGQEKLDEALTQFEKAAELAPEEVSPLINQARVYGAQREMDDALAALDKALAIDPASIAARMFRVQVHLLTEDAEKALDELNEVLGLRPDLVQALLTKAQVLASTDRVGEAIPVLQKVAELAPDNAQVLAQLGFYYLIVDNYSEAIRTFSKVLELEEENVAALRGRSDAYLSVGEHAKAIADYERAVKLAPEDSTILNNFAWVLATSPQDDLRDGERALELAEQASEVTEYKEAHILSTLAAAHAELGDFEKAREWSGKAVQIGEQEAKEEEEPGPAAEQLVQLKAELESYKQEKPWRELQQKKDGAAETDVKEPPAEIKPAPAATSEF